MSLEIWSEPGMGVADGEKMSYAILPLLFTAPGINRRVKPLEIPSLVVSITSRTPALYCDSAKIPWSSS